MSYHIDGLRTIQQERTERDPMGGKMRVRYLMFVPDDGIPMPSVIIAAALIVHLEGDTWCLQHIVVEDEARRCGWAEQIVLALEREHGQICVMWCTESGVAFARRFIAKHGARPTWRVGGYTDAEMRRIVGRLAGVLA